MVYLNTYTFALYFSRKKS